MKKVLIIAYQFPPMGGPGVQRTLKFVKHLRSFGYEPVVLTRAEGKMKFVDKTMLSEIPEGVKVFRTNPYDLTELPSALSLVGKVVARKVLIPDGERLWQLSIQKKALEIVKSEGIELVYSTSYPYSDHLLGLYLKKKLNIKWVADFRDEWTNNPYTLDHPHNKIRTAIEKKQEKEVLLTADYLITNTPVMRKNFIENNHLKENNFCFIPNGYDEEDFLGLDASKKNNSKFTMTYTGMLYGRRKPDTFFAALSQLIQENKIAKEKVHVQLIGNFVVEKLTETIKSYGLRDVVHILSYMPHKQCINELLKSDALLLIEGTGRGAEAFYTGKVFEYMNTQRPVLAILPENGVAAELVKKSNIGLVADFDNVNQIKQNILEYYHLWLQGNLNFEPNRDEIKKYERKQLTRQLADVFDKLATVTK